MNNYIKKITLMCAKTQHEAKLSSCVVCNEGAFERGTKYYC